MVHRRAFIALLAAFTCSCADANRSVVVRPHELAHYSTNNAAVCQVADAERRRPIGTCFVINAKEGYVLTNEHVVADTPKIAVSILQKEHSTIFAAATIVATDAKTDLALLKLLVPHVFPEEVQFGSADDLVPGSSVYVIGYHGVLKKVTVRGWTMNKAGQHTIDIKTQFTDAIYLQLPVGSGLSGSPVFRADTGECVGSVGTMFTFIQPIRPILPMLPPTPSNTPFYASVLSTTKGIRSFLERHRISYGRASRTPISGAQPNQTEPAMPIVQPPAKFLPQ